jgi:hypothetical protein
MKKPTVGETDKLRALTEEPESRALIEQYLAAAPEDSGPILEALNAKAEALYPGWQETIERSRRDGVYLRAQVIGCAKRVRARTDLSDFERSNAEDAEAEFNLISKRAQKEGFLSKEDAFLLAESTQVLSAAAGLEPVEAERLRRQALIDRMRTIGKSPKKKKPWFWYARMLALKIPEKDRALPNSKIAGMLWDDWVKEKPAAWKEGKPARPSFDTLLDFIGELRADGTFPPQPARTRRPRG